ncbi:MAG: NCS1 family nucleobase:cation symporter-1 [Phycisphaerae bacterium]|nr:NCS1 family nucleobase:cation symporter-1 [Phycisphaerae bacterium]
MSGAAPGVRSSDGDASALSNADLAPTPPDARTWGTWHVAALWIGMAVCIPSYMLCAGMIGAGLAWWQAIGTVLLGNLIVLVPMILNGHAGTKYGIPFPVLVRASFGTSGAHVPSIARGLVACGWFGIQTWIGGAAISQILASMGWLDPAAWQPLPLLGISLPQLACFLGFWAIHLVIVLRGIQSIKVLESWASPFLLLCGVALLAWAVRAVPKTADLLPPERLPADTSAWSIFLPQLTAMVGFWATLSLNIPDFTRYCRSQRVQASGQLLGLPLTMTLFAFIGVAVTSATVVVFGEAIWDPVVLVGRLDASPTIVSVALLAIVLATLTTNLAANVVSPANGFSNLAPRRIGFRGGALITCIIGVVMMPWKLLETLQGYVFTWLIGYSALLGPIAGIMLADYFLLRRTRLEVNALYDPRGSFAGVRWSAMIALAVGVAPNLPGFLNAVSGRSIAPPIFDSIYSWAWFVGLPLAGVVYWALARGGVESSNRPAHARA